MNGCAKPRGCRNYAGNAPAAYALYANGGLPCGAEGRAGGTQSEVARLLGGTLASPLGFAQGKTMLWRRADLERVLAVLPALNSPTVSQLSDSEWVAVNTIVEECVARDVIPRLKAAKATGIVEYPLNKVVL